jgi:hypothetical protein
MLPADDADGFDNMGEPAVGVAGAARALPLGGAQGEPGSPSG